VAPHIGEPKFFNLDYSKQLNSSVFTTGLASPFTVVGVGGSESYYSVSEPKWVVASSWGVPLPVGYASAGILENRRANDVEDNVGISAVA